jgi:aryl-alcohol dehydrogenase-like predicted oxidoreductase
MDDRTQSRREFLQASSALSLAALAAHACARPASSAQKAEPLPPVEGLERRKFGRTDMQVAVLGFGGAEIGYEKTDKATVAKLLNAALDAGLNVVDTAECYLDSEIAIGETIGARRKEYHLFTKCGHVTPDGKRGDDWSKVGVTKSIERSLKRLNTEVIDLVLLHSCSLEELKRGACIEGLAEAKKQGKTRYIGYSGDSETAKWAVESGHFDALQISVNVADQECIDLVLPQAVERKLGVIAKRPIANAAWRHDSSPGGYHDEYWRRLQALEYAWATGDARKNEGADGPAGIAMRFTAMQPGVSVLIVGTTKPERWRQNAELMRAGPLPRELESAIRARWKAVAQPDWTGRT